MTQDEIVAAATSRNKESLAVRQSGTRFPLSVPVFAFLGEQRWPDRKWAFFLAFVRQTGLKLCSAGIP